jgi:hypothetical protein
MNEDSFVPTLPDGQWTGAMNSPRYFLIDREMSNRLTVEESQELDRFQRLMSECLHRVAPLPIEGTRNSYDELLAKAKTERSG